MKKVILVISILATIQGCSGSGGSGVGSSDPLPPPIDDHSVIDRSNQLVTTSEKADFCTNLAIITAMGSKYAYHQSPALNPILSEAFAHPDFILDLYVPEIVLTNYTDDKGQTVIDVGGSGLNVLLDYLSDGMGFFATLEYQPDFNLIVQQEQPYCLEIISSYDYTGSVATPLVNGWFTFFN